MVSPRSADSPSHDPPAAEREALEYLQTEIEPALRHDHLAPVAQAVHRSVDGGDLASLHRLSERHRRALLRTIEGRLGRGRRRPSPAAVVCLTSAISARPGESPGAEALLARPAR